MTCIRYITEHLIHFIEKYEKFILSKLIFVRLFIFDRLFVCGFTMNAFVRNATLLLNKEMNISLGHIKLEYSRKENAEYIEYKLNQDEIISLNQVSILNEAIAKYRCSVAMGQCLILQYSGF